MNARVGFRLRAQGLTEIDATGQWQLTSKGRERLEELVALTELAGADPRIATPPRDDRREHAHGPAPTGD